MSGDPDRHLKGSWLRKLVSIHEIPTRVFTLDVGRLKGTTFAVRWVSADARAKAIDEARKYLVDHCGWDAVDLYTGPGAQRHEFECRVRLLAVALVNPDNPSQRAADSADEIRQLFEQDEIERLYEELDDFQIERSPWRRWKSPAEFEADVDAFAKGLMPTGWTRSFDSASLRSIATSLADQLRTRTKGSSSATSSPSASGAESTSIESEPETSG